MQENLFGGGDQGDLETVQEDGQLLAGPDQRHHGLLSERGDPAGIEAAGQSPTAASNGLLQRDRSRHLLGDRPLPAADAPVSVQRVFLGGPAAHQHRLAAELVLSLVTLEGGHRAREGAPVYFI